MATGDAFCLGMENEVKLPVDELSKGGGGKFSVHSIENAARIIRRARKQQSEEVLLDIVLTKCTNGRLEPQTKLLYGKSVAFELWAIYRQEDTL